MIWRKSTGGDLQHFALLAFPLPSQGHPTGQVLTLYLAWNASTAGSSFETFYPGPSDLSLMLGIRSNEPITVGFPSSLTFNVTTTAPPSQLPSRRIDFLHGRLCTDPTPSVCVVPCTHRSREAEVGVALGRPETSASESVGELRR